MQERLYLAQILVNAKMAGVIIVVTAQPV